MLQALIKLFKNKKEEAPAVEAPYKIEAPTPTANWPFPAKPETVCESEKPVEEPVTKKPAKITAKKAATKTTKPKAGTKNTRKKK